MPLFQNLISQVLGQAGQTVNTKDPVVDRLLHWMARLQIQVFGPWTQIGRSGITCAVRFRTHESPRIHQCTSPAIAACVACGQPVCIDHALVSASGEAICRGCVEVARQAEPQPQPHNQQQHHQPPPPPRAAGEDPAKLRRKYLRRLGLGARATADEIKRAYRKLATKHHPDRFPESRKEAAHKKFVALGEAKDWLLADLERRRAA